MITWQITLRYITDFQYAPDKLRYVTLRNQCESGLKYSFTNIHSG
jgi:hypothetical protein